mgnify:CR=1 FL=1
MDIQNKILSCLEEVGIILEEDSNIEDIELSNYLDDSLVFIQFIVGLEEAFEINFPDEMLSIENIGTMSTLSSTIENILNYQ